MATHRTRVVALLALWFALVFLAAGCLAWFVDRLPWSPRGVLGALFVLAAGAREAHGLTS